MESSKHHVTPSEHKKQRLIIDRSLFKNLESWGATFEPNQYVWLTSKTTDSMYGKFLHPNQPEVDVEKLMM